MMIDRPFQKKNVKSGSIRHNVNIYLVMLNRIAFDKPDLHFMYMYSAIGNIWNFLIVTPHDD